MADFREFIIAPQDFSGIEKISEGLQAKQAAKAKAAQEAKAQKTANLASLDYLDDKNFLTGTVEDPVVTRELYKIRDKAYQLASVPGMDSSMIKMAISPEVSKLTQSVQTIKTIDAQRKQGLEFAKSQKGIIPQNYDTEFLRNTFLVPDGKGNYKVREDIYNIDPTLNYDAATRKSGSIYNVDEAVGEDIKNMAKASNKYTVKERGADKVLHTVTKNIETATGFEPLLDSQGVFQGVVPQHTIAPQTDETKSINQYLTGTQNPTEPLRLVSDDLYSRVQNNPSIMGAVNADTVEYAKSLGRTPKPEEIIAFQKAKLYDIYSRSGRSGFKREDVKVDLAPVTNVRVSTGGAGGKEPTINDIYTRLHGFVESKLDEYKQNPDKFGKKDWVQANMLDADIRKVVLSEAREALGDNTISVADIKIKLDENGQMGIYNKKDKLLGQLTQQGLNVRATPKAAGKEKEIKSIPPIKSYSDIQQKAIIAFMKANKLGESDAIRILIEKGKLPK